MDKNDMVDLADELQQMIANSGLSKEKMASMVSDLLEDERGQTKKKTPRIVPPVTIFTEIKRNFTCLHCGRQFSVVLKLKAGESLDTLNANGSIQRITSKSPANVDCITHHCQGCEGYIKGLSREELEDRYLRLLNLVTKSCDPVLFGKKITIARSQEEYRL